MFHLDSNKDIKLYRRIGQLGAQRRVILPRLSRDDSPGAKDDFPEEAMSLLKPKNK